MAERNRGMWTCEVCGREFALMHEDRYTVRDEQRSRLMVSIVGSEAEPTMWDAFDCPYCGCQNRVGVRKRMVEDPPEVPDHDDACGECGLSEVCPLSRAVDERDEGTA